MFSQDELDLIPLEYTALASCWVVRRSQTYYWPAHSRHQLLSSLDASFGPNFSHMRLYDAYSCDVEFNASMENIVFCWDIPDSEASNWKALGEHLSLLLVIHRLKLSKINWFVIVSREVHFSFLSRLSSQCWYFYIKQNTRSTLLSIKRLSYQIYQA